MKLQTQESRIQAQLHAEDPWEGLLLPWQLQHRFRELLRDETGDASRASAKSQGLTWCCEPIDAAKAFGAHQDLAILREAAPLEAS